MKYWYCLLLLPLAGCHRHENPALFRIVEHQKFGFMNDQGTVVIPARFTNTSNFSEGLAAVRVGGEFGYIDASGSFVIDPQFDYAEDFENGLAIVALDGQPFYID